MQKVLAVAKNNLARLTQNSSKLTQLIVEPGTALVTQVLN